MHEPRLEKNQCKRRLPCFIAPLREKIPCSCLSMLAMLGCRHRCCSIPFAESALRTSRLRWLSENDRYAQASNRSRAILRHPGEPVGGSGFAVRCGSQWIASEVVKFSDRWSKRPLRCDLFGSRSSEPTMSPRADPSDGSSSSPDCR